jgi:outer membrane protein assembly factor BamE (lipoprotein component of BamABCDE complex)
MWQLLVSIFLIISINGCQTAPIDLFSRVRPEMSKDSVLDIVGSPLRTEMTYGKEKWAYKFYTGEDKDTVILKQITFLNGKVVAYGDDLAEIERLKSIRIDDEKKAERNKALEVQKLLHKQAATETGNVKNNAQSAEPSNASTRKITTMEDLEHEHYYEDMTGYQENQSAQ